MKNKHSHKAPHHCAKSKKVVFNPIMSSSFLLLFFALITHSALLGMDEHTDEQPQEDSWGLQSSMLTSVNLKQSQVPYPNTPDPLDAKIEAFLINAALKGSCDLSKETIKALINAGRTPVENLSAKPGNDMASMILAEFPPKNFNKTNYLKEIVSIVWFLYLKDPFSQGMIILEDTPGSAFFHYLKIYITATQEVWNEGWAAYAQNNPDGFETSTTHFNWMKPQNPHYVINITNEHPSLVFPPNCKYLIFGQLPKKELFLKPTNQGKTWIDKALSIPDGTTALLRRGGWVGSNDAPLFRKEHIPSDIWEKFKKIYVDAGQTAPVVNTIKEIMAITKHNISIHNQLVLLQEEIKKKYPDADDRYGNEVRWTLKELKDPNLVFASKDAQPGNQNNNNNNNNY